MAVTPDRVRRAPTLFGKQGVLSPWCGAVAATIILYFRVTHLEQPPSVFITAALKAAPALILFALTLRLIDFGAVETYAKRIGKGLVCSAIGDVLIELESAYKDDFFFIGGLVAFLVGHLFYTAAFRIGVERKDYVPTVVAPAGLYVLALVGYLYSYLPVLLVAPVLLFVGVFAVMAATAACRTPTSNAFSSKWSQKSGKFGALTFVLSDSVLAINKFAFAVPGGNGLVMGTYYVGQFLIAMSAWGAWEPAEEYIFEEITDKDD